MANAPKKRTVKPKPMAKQRVTETKVVEPEIPKPVPEPQLPRVENPYAFMRIPITAFNTIGGWITDPKWAAMFEETIQTYDIDKMSYSDGRLCILFKKR